VEDYYEAVDREDWDYTYDNLDSQSRQRFTREEWKKENQWFADNEQLELSSLEIDTRIAPSSTATDVTVYRTFKDGSSSVRDTYFIYEDDPHLVRYQRVNTSVSEVTRSYCV